MGNSNDEQKKTPAVKQAQDMQPNAKSKAQSNSVASKNYLLLLSGAFIMALGALATALYTYSLNQQLQSQLIDKKDQLVTQINKLEKKQDRTEDQIKAKTNKMEEARTTLQAKFDELNKQLQTAISQRFYENQNWLLLKARYFLELAQINAHWSKDISPTIAMLQQADQLLQQLNAPKIFDIRQAIAKDIAELQALPKVDIAGVLSQLDAAQNSLTELHILSSLNNNKPETTKNPVTPQSELSVWRLHLQDSMNLLSKLVVIRRNDENIKPLLSPAFEALLKENIRLNLQEAEWAVLDNNQKVYQLVLQQAITMLKKNFSEGAPNTAALIKKLGELQQIQLNPPRSEIGAALPLLNQFIDTKEPVANQSSNQEQGGNSQ